MSCDFAYDDGAYVLGALAPAERATYEQHLAGCPTCREAVAQLAVLPGLLRRLGSQEAMEPLAESVDRLPRLIDRMHVIKRRRVRQRRLTTVSLVALCFALMIGMGMSVLQDDHPAHPPTWSNPAMVPMRRVSTDAKVTAEVAVREVTGGVEVAMHCSYPSGNSTRPWTYRLIAVGSDGATEQIGSWVSAPGYDMSITGTTRYHMSDLIRLELRAHDGTPLLAYDLP